MQSSIRQKHLDFVKDVIIEGSKKNLLGEGFLVPLSFIISYNDDVHIVPADFTEVSKEDYAQIIRQLSHKYCAVGVVFVSEAYKYDKDQVKKLGIDKIKDQLERYRESHSEFVLKDNPYCKEVIHIIEEYTDGVYSTSIPIERSRQGEITFGKQEESFGISEDYSGIMTNMIGKPDIEELLETIIKKKGENK